MKAHILYLSCLVEKQGFNATFYIIAVGKQK